MPEFPTLAASAMSSSLGKALRGKGMQVMPKNTLELPEISITGIKEMPSYQITGIKEMPSYQMQHSPHTKTRTPRVQLISRSDPDSRPSKNSSRSSHLHLNVSNLLREEFSLRTSNGKRRRSQTSPASDPMSRPNSVQLTMTNTDVCIYLFTNATIEDGSCFRDLCSAIALKIPVIYVRDCKDQLPDTFAECVQRHSQGCVSLKEYIEKYVDDKREPQIQINQKRMTIRPNNRLAPLAVRCRPASASELNVRGIDIRKGRRKQASADGTDLLMYFMNSFKSALIFDENDRLRCSNTLKRHVYKVMGSTLDDADTDFYNSFGDTNNSSHSDFILKNTINGKHAHSENSGQINAGSLKVPEAEVMISTREWGTPGTVYSPPNDKMEDDGRSNDGRFSYDIRMVSPFPLEEKATTYLLFRDKFSHDGIRKINFPLQKDEFEDSCDDLDSDEFDPTGSPIQIPDIDLAREINKALDTPDSDM